MSFTHFLVISAFFGTFYIVLGDRYIGDMCSACLAVAYQFDQAFVKVKIFTFTLHHGQSSPIITYRNVSMASSYKSIKILQFCTQAHRHSLKYLSDVDIIDTVDEVCKLSTQVLIPINVQLQIQEYDSVFSFEEYSTTYFEKEKLTFLNGPGLKRYDQELKNRILETEFIQKEMLDLCLQLIELPDRYT